ncbi:MAG: acetyl-CoA carboxylase biotin carboxyl carrier protein subunit [Caulobacteraceae bacterium]
MAEIEVRSEINANVWQVLVSPGDAVEPDQDLLVLESMKMEIPVPSPCAGTVAKICVAEKEAVSELQVLVLIES